MIVLKLGWIVIELFDLYDATKRGWIMGFIGRVLSVWTDMYYDGVTSGWRECRCIRGFQGVILLGLVLGDCLPACFFITIIIHTPN